MYQGRGRGRGNTYDAHFADTQYSTDSFEHGISSSHGDPSRERFNPPPGPHPRRELMTPSENRGKGRGVPTRFGGGTIDEFPEDSEVRPRKAPPEMERVDSPEVILIEPERSRRAPPRPADHDKDRKHSSRQDDSRNVRSISRDHDRSRDNDDMINRVHRGDPSFVDDRRRSDRPDDRDRYSWEYEGDRRNRRDETGREREPSRTSRREKDNRESSREQHGRVTRRSRSRSPLGDKNAAVHRNLS
jgi:hypothetical protein